MRWVGDALRWCVKYSDLKAIVKTFQQIPGVLKPEALDLPQSILGRKISVGMTKMVNGRSKSCFDNSGKDREQHREGLYKKTHSIGK